MWRSPLLEGADGAREGRCVCVATLPSMDDLRKRRCNIDVAPSIRGEEPMSWGRAWEPDTLAITLSHDSIRPTTAII